MNNKVPHLVQYQGSKRKLANQILSYMPKKMERLVEPFSGTAAISIAAAFENRADRYCMNDLNQPLIGLLEAAIETPEELIDAYSAVWNEQFDYGDEHTQHFYDVRERFNEGDTSPANMLYLLARCVKGSVRYGRNGKFNQSPDKRRHGTSPMKLAPNVYMISRLLKGRTEFSSVDYKELFDDLTPNDLVYMDPPYQGVSNVKDHRYLAGVTFDEFMDSLHELNRRGIHYIVSYDGSCGEKAYGQDIPLSLGCKKIVLNAGISTQATLMGKKETTYEALYVSEGLISLLPRYSKQLSLLEVIHGRIS